MSKNTWEVGATVHLGGRQYIVMGSMPPRAKGEGPVWVLDSPDHTKTYEWVAFRGLTLIHGDLVRPARAARRKAERAQANARKAQEAAAALGARVSAQPTLPEVIEDTSESGMFRVLDRMRAWFRPDVKRTNTVQNPPSVKPPGGPKGK